MIIDTHAHYDDHRFDDDRENVLNNLKNQGIEYCVNVASTIGSLQKTLELVEGRNELFGTVGIHPSELGGMSEAVIERMRELAAHPKMVAVGEIGLDYHIWKDEPLEVPKEEQRRWFLRQLELAKEVHLPIIIHSRDAAKETMDILKETHAGAGGGVIHCYSYSARDALEYVKMGFFIGVGGVVTFQNAHKLCEVVQKVPLERIVLETDCPYMAPVPKRGERNDSSNLVYVAAKIAGLKGVTREEVEEVTFRNALELYPKMRDGVKGEING